MPLEGLILIAQASREVDIDEATFGCQVAGNLRVDFPFDVKDDFAPLPIDNLAEFCAGFTAAGGAEFNDVAKLNSFLRWFDAVHLPIVPFSDVKMVAVKRRDFNGVEFMFGFCRKFCSKGA